MKKASIEMLLLLSNIQGKKQIAEFCKELKAMDTQQVDNLLTQIEGYKTRTFQMTTNAIEIETEQARVRAEAERQKQREAAEAERERQREISGTTQEILRLLLTRYHLTVPLAANKLSAELAKKGYRSSFEGPQTKPNLTKWIKELCEKVPKDTVMSATLNLRPPQ